MQDVKGFDKHIERCLSVRNDSALHKECRRNVGAELGFHYPSILTSSTPDLSILSLQDDKTSNNGSVKISRHRKNSAEDISALKIN